MTKKEFNTAFDIAIRGDLNFPFYIVGYQNNSRVVWTHFTVTLLCDLTKAILTR